MSSTVDHVAFMAPRPREEPSTTHPSAVPAAPAPIGASLPPFGAAISKPPTEANPSLFSGSNTRAPELPTPPEPAKITELPRPVVPEPKPTSNAGASLPSVSSLDAPPQPPKEPAGEAPKPAATAPGQSVADPVAPTEKPAAVAPVITTTSTLNKPVEAVAPVPAMSTLYAPSFPKPVEMKSVPDTPVNTGTPAGGTPRPVLDISQEMIQKPEPEAAKPTPTSLGEAAKPAQTSVNEAAKPESSLNGATEKPVPAAPAPAPAPAVSIPGLSATAGQKRKLEDEAELRAEAEQAEKKAKLEEAAKPGSNGATEVAATDAAPAPAPAPTEAPARKKPGRPKKSKTPAPVGRTQRKTRSQGPAEGSS